MNKRDYMKEIKDAEKELKELLRQADTFENKIIVKLSDIKTSA